VSSAPVPFFAGQVLQGQLVFDDYAAFARHVARLEGRRVRVSVRRGSSARTLPQNARLWAIYGLIAEWSGNDPEAIHGAMKDKFLPPRFIITPKGTLTAPPSTRLLDIEGFAHYMDRVEAWAVEQGVVMPDWTKVE
jgi:hypothetical protein